MWMTLLSDYFTSCPDCSAQQNHVPSSTGLIPTIPYGYSERLATAIQVNWIPQGDQYYLFSNIVIEISKHVALNSGYMYIKLSRQYGVTRNQSTIFERLRIFIPLHKITMDEPMPVLQQVIDNGQISINFLAG